MNTALRYMYFRLVCLILLLVTVKVNTAQDSAVPIVADPVKSYNLSAFVHGGFVVPHRKELRNLITGHSQGITLSLHKQSDGSKAWHHTYRKPLWGLEFYYSSLGNRAQLGQQCALSANVQFPLLQQSRWRAYSIWGLGAGYTTRIWDIDQNLKNIALGSSFNICLTAGCGIGWQSTPRLSFDANFRITHLSNGAFTHPNMGTNNIMASLGVRYGIGADFLVTELTIPAGDPDGATTNGRAQAGQAEKNKHHIALFANSGIKENLPPGGPKHFVHNLAAAYTHRFSNKSGFLLRSDLWYNRAISVQIRRDEGAEPDAIDLLQVGLSAGYVRYFGRLQFEVQMGAYLRTRYIGNGLFYHRFLFNHDLGKGFSGTLGLKTHWTRADHPELGMSYTF